MIKPFDLLGLIGSSDGLHFDHLTLLSQLDREMTHLVQLHHLTYLDQLSYLTQLNYLGSFVLLGRFGISDLFGLVKLFDLFGRVWPSDYFGFVGPSDSSDPVGTSTLFGWIDGLGNLNNLKWTNFCHRNQFNRLEHLTHFG